MSAADLDFLAAVTDAPARYVELSCALCGACPSPSSLYSNANTPVKSTAKTSAGLLDLFDLDNDVLLPDSAAAPAADDILLPFSDAPLTPMQFTMSDTPLTPTPVASPVAQPTLSLEQELLSPTPIDNNNNDENNNDQSEDTSSISNNNDINSNNNESNNSEIDGK